MQKNTRLEKDGHDKELEWKQCYISRQQIITMQMMDGSQWEWNQNNKIIKIQQHLIIMECQKKRGINSSILSLEKLSGKKCVVWN